MTERRHVWGMSNGQAMFLGLIAIGFVAGQVLARLIIWFRCASCTLTW